MLDGFQVVLGDSVWDILLQKPGSVTFVDGSGFFTADFGAGKVLTYASGGRIAGVRRAYWRDPVLTLPRKGDQQWSLLQVIVNAVRGA